MHIATVFPHVRQAVELIFYFAGWTTAVVQLGRAHWGLWKMKKAGLRNPTKKSRNDMRSGSVLPPLFPTCQRFVLQMAMWLTGSLQALT